MARVGIFLIAVSLIAAMAGCAPAPQHDLAILSTDGSTETGTDSIIPASIEFAPDVLNLRSKGQFLTAYIELPPGYDVGQIDVSSIRLNGTVPALTRPTTIGDYDSDGVPDLMVKFDRAAVEALLMPAGQVEMTIMGEVAGIAFEGSDTVRVTNPAWCSLNVSSTTGGSVSVPGEGIFSYKAKTVVDLVATAASGYHFVNWTGDVGTVGDVNAASTNVTMNGHYSITANFMAQYDLTISSTAGGSVSAPGEGTFTYDAETVVNLVATPASGYGFVKWTGDVGTVADINAASTNITMNGHYSITANFEQPVTFPDANLEAAIRKAISKPTGPIYPSDLKGLFYLSASGENIADLTGLEYCTSLNHLWLNDNRIADISPLANLRTLTDLHLDGNKISDISPLANLTGLGSLYLEWNNIGDISPLANLTRLRSLTLSFNSIGDFGPLANLTGLQVLKLDYNLTIDITPLANLTNLTSVALSGNGIYDVSPLANLTGLRSLFLNSNSITYIGPLATLTNLTSLDLSFNQIGDLSPLANLTGLGRLYLSANLITNISPLAGLINLWDVGLRHNQISDVSPLVQNAGLGKGDDVDLLDNPLSPDSINIYIPQLQDRGVDVLY